MAARSGSSRRTIAASTGPASRSCGSSLSVNNRFRFPRGQELQRSFINYAARNAHQGHERARSSLDLTASWPLRNERRDVTFTFTDMFAEFGVRREFEGLGFTALYENLKGRAFECWSGTRVSPYRVGTRRGAQNQER